MKGVVSHESSYAHDLICVNKSWLELNIEEEKTLSNLLWADNEGDGHQHQAVPHVQHQANLVEDSNDNGDNKKDKDDDDGDTAADDDDDGRPQ